MCAILIEFNEHWLRAGGSSSRSCSQDAGRLRLSRFDIESSRQRNPADDPHRRAMNASTQHMADHDSLQETREAQPRLQHGCRVLHGDRRAHRNRCERHRIRHRLRRRYAPHRTPSAIASYVGVDIVRYEQFPANAKFIQVPLDTIPWPIADRPADVAMSVETIEHLENPPRPRTRAHAHHSRRRIRHRHNAKSAQAALAANAQSPTFFRKRQVCIQRTFPPSCPWTSFESPCASVTMS